VFVAYLYLAIIKIRLKYNIFMIIAGGYIFPISLELPFPFEASLFFYLPLDPFEWIFILLSSFPPGKSQCIGKAYFASLPSQEVIMVLAVFL